MEKMRVECPNCEASFKAPAEAAGRRAKCPKCEHRFVLSAPTPAEESPVPPTDLGLSELGLLSTGESLLQPTNMKRPHGEPATGSVCSRCGQPWGGPTTLCPACRCAAGYVTVRTEAGAQAGRLYTTLSSVPWRGLMWLGVVTAVVLGCVRGFGWAHQAFYDERLATLDAQIQVAEVVAETAVTNESRRLEQLQAHEMAQASIRESLRSGHTPSQQELDWFYRTRSPLPPLPDMGLNSPDNRLEYLQGLRADIRRDLERFRFDPGGIDVALVVVASIVGLIILVRVGFSWSGARQ